MLSSAGLSAQHASGVTLYVRWAMKGSEPFDLLTGQTSLQNSLICLQMPSCFWASIYVPNLFELAVRLAMTDDATNTSMSFMTESGDALSGA